MNIVIVIVFVIFIIFIVIAIVIIIAIVFAIAIVIVNNIVIVIIIVIATAMSSLSPLFARWAGKQFVELFSKEEKQKQLKKLLIKTAM